MGQFSLYRRYRPQTFGDVVGQGHVTTTLQNALTEDRVAHACLFSGPRGTGKTSTAAANNALLKVLEEPPAHVIFVFATTEPSKVLQTVQDRCQRYEFRALEPDAVARRILHVCAAEGVTIEEAAVSLLAARASGSMRDVLGLLEQAIMYSGNSIGAEDIARLFGSVSDEVLFEAIDLISERD